MPFNMETHAQIPKPETPSAVDEVERHREPTNLLSF